MKKIVIAIDGFSSAGKSSFAKVLATRLGYVFIDTGAMYRAVTLYAIRHHLKTNEAIISALPKININFHYNLSRGASDIYLNGENVETDIRELHVSRRVSEVSTIVQVREKLVALQQAMGRKKGIVMDGRDIGTVVFPYAELKIFITADPIVRARRRHNELTVKGEVVSFDEVERNVRIRDKTDQNRNVSPLRQAPDAVVLDNSKMTIEEQLEWIKPLLSDRGVSID